MNTDYKKRRCGRTTHRALVTLAVALAGFFIVHWLQMRRHRQAADRFYRAGRKAYEDGDFAKAVREFTATTQADPASAQNWRALAGSYSQRHDYHKALQALGKALQLAPRDPRTLVAIGGAWLEMGRFEKAEHAYREALACDPNDPVVNRFLGQCILKQAPAPDRLEEAKQRLTCALQFRPGYARAHYWLGRAYIASDRDMEALTQFQAALQHDRMSLDAQYQLGVTYLRLGMKERGEKQLTEFRRMSQLLDQIEHYRDLLHTERKASVHFELAKLLADRHFTAKAADQYRLGLQLEPDNRPARAALQQLDRSPVSGERLSHDEEADASQQ